jgi:hypothetical protein
MNRKASCLELSAQRAHLPIGLFGCDQGLAPVFGQARLAILFGEELPPALRPALEVERLQGGNERSQQGSPALGAAGDSARHPPQAPGPGASAGGRQRFRRPRREQAMERSHPDRRGVRALLQGKLTGDFQRFRPVWPSGHQQFDSSRGCFITCSWSCRRAPARSPGWNGAPSRQAPGWRSRTGR